MMKEKKVVLVTGASGYLGGSLCRALLADGHSVRAFVRRSSDLGSLPLSSTSSSFELAYGDVTDLPSLLAASSGCDVVFHTAAVVEPWLPDPSRFLSVNVGGLKNVLEACKKTKSVEKIIYTSSFFALGSTDGYVADEEQGIYSAINHFQAKILFCNPFWNKLGHSCCFFINFLLTLGIISAFVSSRASVVYSSLLQVHQGKFFCTEYEKSKAIADAVALHAASEGLPIILLYPGVIYGPGKMTAGNAVARILIERFNGRLPGYIGDGKDKVSLCHVEDVVKGHVAALHKGRMGERYLLTGENVSFVDVFNDAALITKTRRPWFHIPLWLIEIYGWISVFFARITGTVPTISYPTVWVLKHQWAYSCRKAREELGYSPRSMNEGLEEILPWLKSLGLIKY
ncbi:uncharacterized protein M6B38_358120 [Iris pallida]|uniref:Uncharacterized protein n=1 Tax=Iris pallida TaxID=29817 RepID=A0AAX6GM47_IRIPA|nr:uncharacterized protein M6B38_358120 [Iris pallida]